MNGRDLISALLAWLAAIAFLPPACAVPAGADPDGPAKRPNIILIMADDLGYETLGCHGSTDYETPHLDALAASGIRFDHCYSQPLCTPSRVQIMTGRYNHRNYQGFGYLDPQEVTFANLLRDAGYKTCIAGKWQLCGDAKTVEEFGFDEHCLWNMHVYRKGTPDAKQPENYRRRYDAPVLFENGKWTEHEKGVYGPEVCCEFICNFISRNKESPFLVYYPMILTHDPFVPTPDSTPVEDDVSEDDEDNDKQKKKRKKKRNFGDMVRYMDGIVGRIVAHLEEQEILDDTLILFTADNGTHTSITSNTAAGPVKGGKSFMTNAGTRVPFIAYRRGVTPEGLVLDDLVDFSDFLPSLCEAAGCPVPDDRIIDGRSFLPRLEGRKGAPREWIFCHYWKRGRNEEETRQYVRDRRWKLYDNGEMYDIDNDVPEKSPLDGTDPEAAAARKRLQSALDAVRKLR